MKKIEITYDYDETYTNLRNTIIDYENETQNWDFEYLFEDFVDYEIAEQIAEEQLKSGGLERLKYYIGDTIFFENDIFRIDGYGNLQNIDIDDLKFLKEQILDEIERKVKNEK